MIPSTAVAPETELDIRREPVEVLLSDPEWVDAEFAAIMTISGFGDRVAVAVLTPSGPDVARRQRRLADSRRAQATASALRAEARVRSPPRRL